MARTNLILAVTWRMIAEMYRRHHSKYPLRFFETHPCDGQYDCVDAYLFSQEQNQKQHLCSFHHRAQHLHIWEPVSKPRAKLETLRWPGENDYVRRFIYSDDPGSLMDELDDMLGFPKKHNSKSDPTAVTFKVIGGLLGLYSLSRFTLDLRSGWEDVSWPGHTGLRADLMGYPGISEMMTGIDPSSSRAMDIGSQFWLLNLVSENGQKKNIGLFTLDGKFIKRGAEDYTIDLWACYKANGRRIEPALNEVVESLGLKI